MSYGWKEIDQGLYSMFMSKQEYIHKVADEIIESPEYYADGDCINEYSIHSACDNLGISYSEFSVKDLEEICELVREGIE